MGHDVAGAEIGAAVLEPAARERAAVASTSRRSPATTCGSGFLVHEMPLGRRAVYRYLRACEPVEVDVTLLSVADRLATRGRGLGGGDRPAPRARAPAARRGARLAARARRGRRCAGDGLAQALGIEPGAGARAAARRARGGELRRRDPTAARRRSRGRGELRARRRATAPAGRLRGAAVSATPTASSARSSPASCRARSSTRTSARSRSWTSTRRRAGTRSSIPRRHAATCSRSSPRTSRPRSLAAQRLARRVHDRLGADGVNLLNSCGQRGVADRVPLPHPRDPALRGRPAAAAVDSGAGRPRRDRRGRRRSCGEQAAGAARRAGARATAGSASAAVPATFPAVRSGALTPDRR